MSSIGPNGLLLNSVSIYQGDVKPLPQHSSALKSAMITSSYHQKKTTAVAIPILSKTVPDSLPVPTNFPSVSSTSLGSSSIPLSASDMQPTFAVPGPRTPDRKRTHAEMSSSSSVSSSDLLNTPPAANTRGKKFPSPSVQASPTFPKSPAVAHSAHKLISLAPRDIKKLSGKKKHTMATTNSPYKKAQLIKEYYHDVSKQRKHLEKYPGDQLEPIAVDDKTQIVVKSPKTVQVEDQSRTRTFSFHESTTPTGQRNKSLFFVKTDDDDDLIQADLSGSALTPNKLAIMALAAKQSGNSASFVQSLIRLSTPSPTPSPASGNSSSSDTTKSGSAPLPTSGSSSSGTKQSESV